MKLKNLLPSVMVSAVIASLLAVGGTPLAQVTPVQATSSQGWSALGTGMPNGTVFQVAPASNGMVYAGGTFTSAGGVTNTLAIAQWNPTVSAWQAVGGGLASLQNNRSVYAVAHDPTRNLVFVGGSFDDVVEPNLGTLPRQDFAIWNVSNSTWNEPRGGRFNPASVAGVEEIAVMPSGEVYVGGDFRLAGDLTGNGFFRRTTTPTMAGVGGGITLNGNSLGIVNGMVSDGGNGVVIGGQFDKVNGTATAANRVARWDGTAWSAFGAANSGPFDGLVAAVATTSGRVFIGGNFSKVQNAGTDVPGTTGVAMWNGTQWVSIGSMVGSVIEELRVIGNYVYAGGQFVSIGGVVAMNIARYNLSTGTWEAVTHECFNGVNGVVRSIVDTGLGDGSIYVGGGFTDAGGVTTADRIAKYTPSSVGCNNVVLPPPTEAPSDFRVSGLARDRVNGRSGMRVQLSWRAASGYSLFIVTTKGLRSGADFDRNVEHTDLACTTTEQTCSIFFPFTSNDRGMNGRQYHQVIYTVRGYGSTTVGAPAELGPLAQVDGRPASAPQNVRATASWKSITVTWDDPADLGTAGFVTNYVVQAQPGGEVCIVSVTVFPADATARQCTFNNLKSRVDYAFTVRALTFAGWSAASTPSTRVAQLDLEVTSALRTTPFFSFPGTTRVRVSGVASGYPSGTRLRTFMEIGTGGWREVRNANVRVDSQGRFVFIDTISFLYARRTVGVRFEVDTQGRCGEPHSSRGTCGQSDIEVMGRV